ncbi:hypothetical protein U1Q18_012239, partial [Sarracenia purpurea var. burkii]
MLDLLLVPLDLLFALLGLLLALPSSCCQLYRAGLTTPIYLVLPTKLGFPDLDSL